MSERRRRTKLRPSDSERYRILFVTSDKFPPFRPAAKAIFGGGLQKHGHRVDWLLQAEEPGVTAGLRRYRGGVACVAQTNDGQTRTARLRKYLIDLRNDLRVVTLLKRNGYSLVQVKDKYIGALIVLAAARLRGVPVVYWLAYPHGEASQYAAQTGVARYRYFYAVRGAIQKWLLYRVIMPACTHVFVQSEQMRTDVAREGVPLEKMTPVPSSVRLDEFDVAAESRVTLQPRTVVYLGTLLRERRLDFLVRVHARVRRSVPDARLVFVGRGENPEDEETLEREAERLGVSDSVAITGWLPMETARDYVRAAAVCVSPYYPVPILLSTSPTKLIEYMAYGRPVVANDHPEQSEVIRASGAGLVCRWDEDEFASAVAELLQDEGAAEAMGGAGRRFVERHRTHAVMVARVAHRYGQVLSGAGALQSKSALYSARTNASDQRSGRRPRKGET